MCIRWIVIEMIKFHSNWFLLHSFSCFLSLIFFILPVSILVYGNQAHKVWEWNIKLIYKMKIKDAVINIYVFLFFLDWLRLFFCFLLMCDITWHLCPISHILMSGEVSSKSDDRFVCGKTERWALFHFFVLFFARTDVRVMFLIQINQL